MDAVMVSALVAGIIAVISAISGAVVLIINALQASKAGVDAVLAKTNAQTEILDHITVLVDGRYGEVLQELANVKSLLAQETGAESDAIQAAAAQTKADEQAGRVRQAEDQGNS